MLISPPRRAECTLSWTAHYLIGVTFALVFFALAGPAWLRQPTPIPALRFDLASVLAPIFIMPPVMGLGLTASRTPNPGQARLRSGMDHVALGAGL